MSLFEDCPIREELFKQDNRFSQVLRVASLARKKSHDCQYQILDSEALTWAIQGIEPKQRKQNQTDLYISQSNQNVLDSVLAYGGDDEIDRAVRDSFKASKKSNKLTYEYNNILDEYRRTKVRILVRMVWYKQTE